MDQNQIVSVSLPDELETKTIRPYELETIPAAGWQSTVSEDEQFISPRFLMRVLSQWWYVALPTACVLALISAAILMVNFTPVYRSTAVLKIASYTPYIAYSSDEERAADPEEFTETQIELLRSPLVMEQVLASNQITELPEVASQERPVSWLSSCVRVSQVGNSELYYVHFDGPDPDNSALLANSILDEYFAVRTRDQEEKTKHVLELLAQEKETRGKLITKLREKMRELGQEVAGHNPITGMPLANRKYALAPLDKLGEMMVKAEFDRRMIEMEITAREQALENTAAPVPEAQVEIALSETHELQNLRSLIAAKKEMLHRIESASAAGRDDPGYRRIEREVASYERNLQNAASRARPMIKEQLEMMAELENQDMLDQLESQLEAKKVEEAWLVERYNEQLAETSKSGDKLLELEFARNELLREEKVFHLIAERSMALQTESRAPGRVSLLQRAEPPLGPMETIPLRNLAAIILVSGCIPFGLALLWELSVRRIADADQLAQQSALPVVGEIAKLPMRLHTITPGGSRAMNLFEESIDSLRVGLILPDQYRDVRVIAVTSAVHGEGKSSISSQLAVSLGSSTGGPVLLIDGDLRAPDVHHIFGVANDLGFTSVLEGKASLEEAIITSWSDQVHILPAGRLKRSPHKLMGYETLEQMLKELREQYRYIVIDTPPILSASEALLLGKVADGVVLSTRRNVSREVQVKTAHQRLLKAGARPLGAVFNGVPTRSYMQTYGSYGYARNFEQ